MVSVPAWLVPAWDSGVVSSVGGVPSAKEESPAWLPAPSKWRGLGKLVPGSPSPGETEEWARLGAPGGEGTGWDRQGGGVLVSRQSWLNRLPGLVRPSRGHRCPVLAPTLPTGARGSGGVPSICACHEPHGGFEHLLDQGPTAASGPRRFFLLRWGADSCGGGCGVAVVSAEPGSSETSRCVTSGRRLALSVRQRPRWEDEGGP